MNGEKMRKKIMKLFLVVMMVGCLVFTQVAEYKAAEESVTGVDIKNGDYSVEVESDSSMFNIVKAELTVEDGNMSAVITLSGTGYSKLYMGTSEEAGSASEEEFITYEEDAAGAYTYEIPVEAVEQEFPCAAFSKKKESWYDRVLIIHSDSISKEAEVSQELVAYAPIDLEDGTYKVKVVLEGGSGKSTIISPATIKVKNGQATAVIEWSSSNYDYMKIGSKTYNMVNTEGNSTFELPVTAWDKGVAIIGNTTAMSKPHEVQYTLMFVSDSVEKQGNNIAVVVIVAAVVVVLATAGIIIAKRKKKE
jgi:hypothetical protein